MISLDKTVSVELFCIGRVRHIRAAKKKGCPVVEDEAADVMGLAPQSTRPDADDTTAGA